MKENEVRAELEEIRRLMDSSTRFLSLSGASGIWIGLTALMGVAAMLIFQREILFTSGYFEKMQLEDTEITQHLIQLFTVVAVAIILLSLFLAVVLTVKRTGNASWVLWSTPAKRLWINLMIPLMAGGVFCMILMSHRLTGLLVPSTLIFYGLALVNASKYTFKDLRSLGLIEISLGLVAAINIEYGLVFWVIGFGLLHIVYGWIMRNRYEK